MCLGDVRLIREHFGVDYDMKLTLQTCPGINYLHGMYKNHFGNEMFGEDIWVVLERLKGEYRHRQSMDGLRNSMAMLR